MNNYWHQQQQRLMQEQQRQEQQRQEQHRRRLHQQMLENQQRELQRQYQQTQQNAQRAVISASGPDRETGKRTMVTSQTTFNRRRFLQLGAVGVGAAAWPLISYKFALPEAFAEAVYIEVFPTSPLILNPFTDTLPIPRALRPVPQSVFSAWKHWKTGQLIPPGPGPGQQDADGGTHQIWPSALGLPDPLVYQIKVQAAQYSFTSSQVLPIDSNGRPTQSFDATGRVFPAGTVRSLPLSTVYHFSGTNDPNHMFPGPRINAEYGRPVLVRLENHLDESTFDPQDFGSAEILTHLHNAHTAPESDGNPNYRHNQQGASSRETYLPGQWVDNLYLNYPAGGDDSQKQSFFWFHDHSHSHTEDNVYKGMVGLYPIYDPKFGLDMGDETQGFHLPGVRINNPDGSFDVDFDIPLVLYDCRLDDGVTQHKDFHTGTGETHPEWWGKTYFRHFPNHGFVGDVFTVNGKAYPVLEVKRRKYRLRFLDASVSRIYQLKLMSSTAGPKSAVSLGFGGDELQGQFRLPDGQQCMRFLQIATEGGLLPAPIARDTFELWPAKRREFIVDFAHFMDGSLTRPGDAIYLVDVMKMTNGRLGDSSDPNYKVPVLKIVIGDDAPDNSLIPAALRPLAALPSNLQDLIANRRVFTLQRGGGVALSATQPTAPEIEWLINGQPFDPTIPLAKPKRGSSEAWEIQNGGGGWVHPMHIHQEEHRVVMRNGQPVPDARHPDDIGREDTIALDPSESVVIVRQFRTFTGKYVAHCHNLAHEDHSMMFGWEITD